MADHMSYDDIKLFSFLYENNVKMSDLTKFFKKNLSTLWRLRIKLNLKRKQKKTMKELVLEYKKGKCFTYNLPDMSKKEIENFCKIYLGIDDEK